MSPRTATFLKLLLAAAATVPGACANPVREPPPKPFVGTRWEVVLELPIPGEQPWIVMGDGRLEGYGGCNRVNARYLQDTVGARAIAFGQISSSKRMCDSGAMGAERHLLEVLQHASSYSITGDEMTMTGSAGTMRFRAKMEEKAK